MKQFLATLLVCLTCFTAAAQEQNHRPERPRMTPEEFQAKQKEFIAQHAELTEEESAAFFPLYFELQRKKHEANRRVWKQARAVAPHERTEEDCIVMIDALADVKIECATLEKEYLAKFKEILPAKKLMRIQMAEERYQRELLKGIQKGSGNGSGHGSVPGHGKRQGAPRP
jgi:Spy/CpxP family protein refolding chaperone